MLYFTILRIVFHHTPEYVIELRRMLTTINKIAYVTPGEEIRALDIRTDFIK